MPLISTGELPRSVLALLEARGSQPEQTCPPFAATAWPLEAPENVLARRRAVRQFTDDAVAPQDVETIVEHARQAERSVWPAEAHGVIGYTLVVAAFRITGLVPGLYLVSADPAAGSFSMLASGPWLDSLRAAYADAACLLLICADIAAACRPGAPGYGPLLIRAGTLGHGAWLSAISLGLAGCVYAGPHHRVTEAVRLVDARSNHIFTTSLGRAHPRLGPAGTTPDAGA
jgi:nitroreductase